jgi:hypothetical protein
MKDSVCEYETKFITGNITFLFVDTKGKRRTSAQLDDFVGRTIQSRKLDNRWTHALVDDLVMSDQQGRLAQLRPFFQDREFLPETRQKPGASWDVDRRYIDILLRSNLSAVSGKLKATFSRIAKDKEDILAIIDINGQIRGKIEFGENQETVGTIIIAMTVFRSLKQGIDVKTEGFIKIRSSDVVMFEDNEVDVEAASQFAVSSTVTVEK